MKVVNYTQLNRELKMIDMLLILLCSALICAICLYPDKDAERAAQEDCAKYAQSSTLKTQFLNHKCYVVDGNNITLAAYEKVDK